MHQLDSEIEKPQIDWMRMLTSSASLEAAFGRMLLRHEHLSFAVAWASHNFPAYNQLLRHRKKLKQGIVGIHFYQTHPSFIEYFLNDKRIKFAKDSSGVFHPKLYLFETSATDWSCVIGSANFTAAAFSKNTESCLLLEASDDPSGETKQHIEKTFASYWKAAGYFNSDELKRYRHFWALFRQRRKGMATEFAVKDAGKSPLATPLLGMSWNTYYQRVLRDSHHGVDARIGILKEAHRLFELKATLSRMSKLERQRIGGIVRGGDPNWGWFGSMFGAGVFKRIVNANSKRLSEALDGIPFTGEVRREEYLSYIEGYVSAYPGRRRHGLATATRLLAMKRPDYFVCFDAENRKGLCKAFGVVLRHHDYERYWDSVIERILISEWWTSPRPKADRERAIWDGRAAFLDSLYYKPTARS